MYSIRIKLRTGLLNAVLGVRDVLQDVSQTALLDTCFIDFQASSTVITARHFINPVVWEACDDEEREKGAAQLIRSLVPKFGIPLSLIDFVAVRYDAQHPPFTREVITTDDFSKVSVVGKEFENDQSA